MVNQELSVSKIGQWTLQIGHAGDNEHTNVAIDCTEIFADYPSATVTVVVNPYCEDSYPAVSTVENGIVNWVVTASDTRQSGSGTYQLIFRNGETEVWHSAVGKFVVRYSIDIDGEAPAPIISWIENAEQTAKEIARQAAAEAGIAANVELISGTNYRLVL